MKSTVESSPVPQLTAIARFVKAVGLAGDLKVELLCEGADRLKRVSKVWVGATPAQVSPATMTDVRVQGNGVMVRLSSCSDRTGAEKFRGLFVFVADADSVPPKHGSVRIDDLIGCDVESEDGTKLGVIHNVYSLPSGDTWGVWTGTQEVLVPAVRHWIRHVDMQRRRVIVAGMEELFDKP